MKSRLVGAIAAPLVLLIAFPVKRLPVTIVSLLFVFFAFPAVAEASAVIYKVAGTFPSAITGNGNTSFAGNFTYDPADTAAPITYISFTAEGLTFDTAPQGMTITPNYNYTISEDTADKQWNFSLNWTVGQPTDTFSTFAVLEAINATNQPLTSNDGLQGGSIDVTPTPLPSAWLMMLTGLALLIPLYCRNLKPRQPRHQCLA